MPCYFAVAFRTTVLGASMASFQGLGECLNPASFAYLGIGADRFSLSVAIVHHQKFVST